MMDFKSELLSELPMEPMEDTVHPQVGAVDGNSMRQKAAGPEAAQSSVLYIEDNTSNIKLVESLFGLREHVHLLTAGTPELGIELAKTQHPDLVLLDINMPGMDGYEVLNVFKADASLRDTPVIAITAMAMARDIERGTAAGFSDYLTKPLNVEHFLKTIDRYLTIDE